MQNYERLYEYIHEYQSLVYDVYSKHALSFLTTYINIDSTATVWDNVNLMGGSYERIGTLSGIKRTKYLLIPVYYIEETSTDFNGDEKGYIKTNETSLVFPSSYGIIPYPGDIIKFEQSFLRTSNDVYPVFIVKGVSKTVNTDITFFKLKVAIEQSRTLTEVENQVTNTYTFLDYTKNIHTIENAQFLLRMLQKQDLLRTRLYGLFDQNSGYYLS